MASKETGFRDIDYRCTNCGRAFTKKQLFTKRVIFAELGEKGRVVRSRTIKWLCEDCMNIDTDFIRERLGASPGFQDTSLAQPT